MRFTSVVGVLSLATAGLAKELAKDEVKGAGELNLLDSRLIFIA